MRKAWVPGWGVLFAALLLYGCGGGDPGNAGAGGAVSPEQGACSLDSQKAWLLAYMSDQYYWFDHLGARNERAPDAESYFRSLLYTPIDRYSSSQPTQSFVQVQSEGTRTGYGYSLVWIEAAEPVLRVRFVEPLSPVGKAGLRRGDTVLSIDGYGPQEIVAGTPGPVSAEGIPRSFRVRGVTGVERSLTALSGTYPITTVPASRLLPLEGSPEASKVGYFVYQNFISSSADALRSVFQDFADAGIGELIVDLRYNGGGSVSMARNVASMIGGSGLSGRTFAEFRFNVRHPERNFSYYFTADPLVLPAAPLQGLKRVVIITSPATASASEIVINSLQPFTNVVLIGETTFGKPYASQPRDYCGITYAAVNYEAVNARGEGGFINGIEPTCMAPEDFEHDLGDANEGRLAAAMAYIRTGACPPAAGQFAASRARAAQVYGETDPPLLIID